MIIKDPVTCESLVRDNYPRMPDPKKVPYQFTPVP